MMRTQYNGHYKGEKNVTSSIKQDFLSSFLINDLENERKFFFSVLFHIILPSSRTTAAPCAQAITSIKNANHVYYIQFFLFLFFFVGC